MSRAVFDVTRRVEFCAGHRLHNPAWDDETNGRVFGACSNPAGHGHNYVLEVTVRGTTDPETGMVVDLKHLKAVVAREVIEAIDHRNLNVDVPFLRGTIPTTENLARAVWERLRPHLPGLFRVRLWESPRNRVDYHGEEEA